MTEILASIAKSQALLANISLTLIEEQETSQSLAKAAQMTRSLQKLTSALSEQLCEWAEEKKFEDQAETALVAAMPPLDPRDED